MVFKNLCVLVLWTKVDSASEGLMYRGSHDCDSYASLIWVGYCGMKECSMYAGTECNVQLCSLHRVKLNSAKMVIAKMLLCVCLFVFYF